MSDKSKILDQWDLTIQPTPALEQELTLAIHHLLNSNIPKLLQILYRLDVQEKRVMEVMRIQDKQLIAIQLARVILERESRKKK